MPSAGSGRAAVLGDREQGPSRLRGSARERARPTARGRSWPRPAGPSEPSGSSPLAVRGRRSPTHARRAGVLRCASTVPLRRRRSALGARVPGAEQRPTLRCQTTQLRGREVEGDPLDPQVGSCERRHGFPTVGLHPSPPRRLTEGDRETPCEVHATCGLLAIDPPGVRRQPPADPSSVSAGWAGVGDEVVGGFERSPTWAMLLSRRPRSARGRSVARQSGSSRGGSVGRRWELQGRTLDRLTGADRGAALHGAGDPDETTSAAPRRGRAGAVPTSLIPGRYPGWERPPRRPDRREGSTDQGEAHGPHRELVATARAQPGAT
jgi:hypothetical protein